MKLHYFVAILFTTLSIALSGNSISSISHQAMTIESAVQPSQHDILSSAFLLPFICDSSAEVQRFGIELPAYKNERALVSIRI